MACVPTPTATLFGTSEIVTTSVSDSISTSITTLPASTITTTSVTCPDSQASLSGTCINQVTVTVTSTIPGATSTITDSVEVTATVTLTSSFPTQTLFGTCPTSPTTNPSSSTTTSDSVTTIPGTTSVFTSTSQSTLADGQVATTFVTFTSSSPPQTVTVPPSPGLNNSGNISSTSSSNLAPIIGGSLGGFFGLLLFVGAFLCWRRRRRWDDIYEKGSVHGIDDDRPVRAPEPAPYHYGLVGHHPAPSISPPSSPTSRPITFHSRVGSSGGASVASNQSSAPLTGPDNLTSPPETHRALTHHQRLSQGSEALLLMRPLEPIIQSNIPTETRQSFASGSGSPTTPRQTFFPLRVTNADDLEAGPSHVHSAQLGSPKRVQQKPSRSPVLVHTDGGRVEGSSEIEETDPSEDNPPAYSKN